MAVNEINKIHLTKEVMNDLLEVFIFLIEILYLQKNVLVSRKCSVDNVEFLFNLIKIWR